jgi:hypothetical protein
VRIQALGLSKTDRQGQGAGLSPAPNSDEVRRRIAILRRYRWSSYACIGLGRAPEWLDARRVMELGGGAKAEWGRRYRDYAQTAVREGLEKSLWESVREQVVLGGAEFLRGLRKHVIGDGQEQRGARRLMAERPALEAVIAGCGAPSAKPDPWRIPEEIP